MQKSKNYGFNLPSRDTDDIADINLISENFSKIDSELSEMIKGKGVDQVYNPESSNPQSGKAISGELVDYVKYEDGAKFVFSGGDAESSDDIQLVIDDELSGVSTNPVQNKVITEAINKTMAALLLATHPVGSLYFSAEPTEPSTLFGGEWERVKDKFILAAGDIYKAGGTGGEASHKLTLSEMPKHSHLSNGGTLFWNSEYGNLGATPGSNIVSASMLNENGVSTGSDIAGSSVPHNNMPPYEAYYCWKRIA